MEKRYNQFLENYKFNSNCIEFRIKSSKALEKWKNVQAFQLNQLVNGKFYFAPDRREIILLKYDIWSRWLYEIENLCLELAGENKDILSTQEDIDYIVSLADKSSDKYKHIMLEGSPAFFNTKFVNCWIEQHQTIYDHMVKTFSHRLVGLCFSEVFVKIVNIISKSMQHTLLEIHEIDVMFNIFEPNCRIAIDESSYNINDEAKHCKGKVNTKFFDDSNVCYIGETEIPFITIDDVILEAYMEFGKCLITKSLDNYREYFDVTEVYIKNYTDKPLPTSLINSIKETGVIINFEKSLMA